MKLLFLFLTTSIENEIPPLTVAAAKENLAQFLQEQDPFFDPNQIVLEGAVSVIWNNSAMGCAEEGHNYLQVLIPGYKIVFRVGQDSFTLHTDETGRRIMRSDKNAYRIK